MKKTTLISAVIFCLFITQGFALAADSSDVAVTGAATMPDMDMKGSDIENVGTLGAGTVNSTTVNSTTLNSTTVKSTTVNSKNIIATGTVQGATVKGTTVTGTNATLSGKITAANGQVTTLDTNRTLVRRTPTANVDAVNKQYTDAKYAALITRITALEDVISKGIGVGVVKGKWGGSPACDPGFVLTKTAHLHASGTSALSKVSYYMCLPANSLVEAGPYGYFKRMN